MGLIASEEGLVSVIMPKDDQSVVLQEIAASFPQDRNQDDGILSLAKLEMLSYLEGSSTAFTVRLDFGEATPFRKSVWWTAISIPWGECRSYQWISTQMGAARASRAVGGALGANPLPVIIPCHRVITSGGALGGYSGGLDTKRWLLNLEGLKPKY